MRKADKKSSAVLWFSIFDWWTSSHGHSDFQLAKKIARNHPVLFINSIGMRMPISTNSQRVSRRIIRKLGSLARGLCSPESMLDMAVLTLATIPGLSNNSAARAIARIQIYAALSRLRWKTEQAIITVPTAYNLAQDLCADRLLYYRSDNHGAFPDVSQAALHGEKSLLQNASLVAYSSRTLMQQEDSLVGARARFLEHGVDSSLFNPAAAPAADLMRFNSPRVGFFGSLRGHSVDFSMIRDVALALPQASILIMGDRLDHAHELNHVGNIHLIPPRPHSEMPHAWNALDVALFPYKDNPWNRAIDPIKLREVLACGVPIAATNLPFTQAFSDLICVSGNRNTFVDAVRQALTVKRTCPSVLPSWEEQAKKLLQLLDDCSNRPSAPTA